MAKQKHPPAKLIDGPRCFVCVGPNCWGKGFTAKTAESAALLNFSRTGRGAWTFIMYDAPADTVIDEMGRSCWMPSYYSSECQTAAIELYRFPPVKKAAPHGDRDSRPRE